jgi:hypothetical protein
MLRSNDRPPTALSEERLAHAILQSFSAPLRRLCRELLADLEPEEPDEPTDEEIEAMIAAKRQLIALWLPAPETDTSPIKEYRWPASRLTVSDMKKLNGLRMQTGRPITVLLHEAVSIMYDLTRSDMAKLQELRDRTGLSIRELLSEAIANLCDRRGPEQSGD